MPGSRAPKSHLNGAGEIALDAIRAHLKALPRVSNDVTQQRSLEYLYSLSVGAVIGAGGHPAGLSFRTLEQLLRENMLCEGRQYFLP